MSALGVSLLQKLYTPWWAGCRIKFVHEGQMPFQKAYKVPYPCVTSVSAFCFCFCFSFFFLSTCQYLSHATSNFDQLWSQKQVYKRTFVTWPVWGQRSCRGHRGQKHHFHQKCYFSYRLWYGPVTHAYSSAKYPLQKLSTQIVIWRHLGSQGSKGHFHKKILFLLQITWYGHVTHANVSTRYPLQKLLVQILIWGYLGSQGSKGHFHQKCFNSFILLK